MLVGIPGAALALLFLATHPPLVPMIVALVVMTTFLAVGYGPYLALLADLVPSEERGRVNAALTIAGMAGQVAILALASFLWEPAEGAVFAVVAAGLILGFAVTVVGVAEPLDLPPSTAPTHPARWLRDLAGQRNVVAFLTATFFFWIASGGVAPFLTRFGVHELGMDEGAALGLLIVALVSTAVFTLPAGWLADRIGKKPVLIAGLVLFGLTAIVGSQVRTVEQATVALVVVGAGNALATVPLMPLLTDLIARERAGELTGVGGAVWELAQPLGAILAGAAADLSGTLRAPLLMAGVSCLIGAVLLLRVHEPSRASGPKGTP
jgi:MFS family permease